MDLSSKNKDLSSLKTQQDVHIPLRQTPSLLKQIFTDLSQKNKDLSSLKTKKNVHMPLCRTPSLLRQIFMDLSSKNKDPPSLKTQKNVHIWGKHRERRKYDTTRSAAQAEQDINNIRIVDSVLGYDAESLGHSRRFEITKWRYLQGSVGPRSIQESFPSKPSNQGLSNKLPANHTRDATLLLVALKVISMRL